MNQQQLNEKGTIINDVIVKKQVLNNGEYEEEPLGTGKLFRYDNSKGESSYWVVYNGKVYYAKPLSNDAYGLNHNYVSTVI